MKSRHVAWCASMVFRYSYITHGLTDCVWKLIQLMSNMIAHQGFVLSSIAGSISISTPLSHVRYMDDNLGLGLDCTSSLICNRIR